MGSMSNCRVASWDLSCTEAIRKRTGYASCAKRNVTSRRYRISPAQVSDAHQYSAFADHQDMAGEICRVVHHRFSLSGLKVCLTRHSVCTELVVMHEAERDEGHKGDDVRSIEDLHIKTNFFS